MLATRGHNGITQMQSQKTSKAERRQARVKAVLPVRISGTDAAGNVFEELVHTLDITPSGGKLGAIHRELKTLDRLTVQYRQHKMEFRVVWIKLLNKAGEYQVGLRAIEDDKAGWGLARSDEKQTSASVFLAAAAAAHGAA